MIRSLRTEETITLMHEGTDIIGRSHQNNFEANAWLAIANILGALARFCPNECVPGVPVVQRPLVAARISGCAAVLG